MSHPVYAGGPPCSPQCPGDWSDYHDGYSAAFDSLALRVCEQPEYIRQMWAWQRIPGRWYWCDRCRLPHPSGETCAARPLHQRQEL